APLASVGISEGRGVLSRSGRSLGQHAIHKRRRNEWLTASRRWRGQGALAAQSGDEIGAVERVLQRLLTEALVAEAGRRNPGRIRQLGVSLRRKSVGAQRGAQDGFALADSLRAEPSAQERRVAATRPSGRAERAVEVVR